MPTRRRTRIRRWVYLRIPEWMRRRDFEVFTAFLCLTASVPILFLGVSPGRGAAILPAAVEYGWSTILFVGPILVLVGVYQGTKYNHQPEQGIFWYRIEAYGLTMLAYAGYVYWGALIWSIGWDQAVFASTVILLFALVCHVREVQIQLDIVTYKSVMGVGDPNGQRN